MQEVIWPIAAVLALVGVMLLVSVFRRPRRARREREPNERLGVRISEEIEQIRSRR